MVAGKVKVTMGIQKSPANPKPSSTPKPPVPSPSSGKIPQKGAVFSRSFGGYFPRSSAQVQPRPPDVAELLHLIEELRERESQLKTELLEQKLLKESVAVLPFLESEISKKDNDINRSARKIDCLETENERLRQEVELLHEKLCEQKREFDRRIISSETKISDLKKALAEREEFIVSSSQRFQGLIDVSGKSNLMRNLKKSATLSNIQLNYENQCKEVTTELKKFDGGGGLERPEHSRSNALEVAETSECALTVRSRVPRVPKPPPKPTSFSALSPTSSSSSSCSSNTLSCSPDRALMGPSLIPPPQTVKLASLPPPPPPRPTKAAPPPPPPPSNGLRRVPSKVRRVPEVVEFYHSLMRRDTRRDASGGCASDAASSANARDMIGEIENRSTHLLAIKTDVETQGDFIRFLIKEVENAAFTDIEDVLPFVKWLDDELSYLVDERAVLKHFQWPEQKADALREAAFGYSDLKKLEFEASSFRDDPRQACLSALKKMQALFEKLEHGVHNLSRMRESATNRYKAAHIPMDWMQDTGYVSLIKLASVKLAMKYMKRVSAELETVDGGPEEEELIVQGVRFAFRVHQFAGGFDVETMRAFQELRDKANSCHIQCQNQQQQKYLSRSSTPS